MLQRTDFESGLLEKCKTYFSKTDLVKHCPYKCFTDWDMYTKIMYICTVNVWILNDQNPHYAEIRTEGNSSFRQIFWSFKPNATSSDWFIDTDRVQFEITVDVRNPDVRISAFSRIVRFPKRPVFRHYLKTGRLCPVFVHCPKSEGFEPNDFQKRRNLNVRIFDNYCMCLCVLKCLTLCAG